MSLGTLEFALHEVSTRGDARRAFLADTQAYLSALSLGEDERELIRSFDVAGLQRLGVSPLLTYGFWMTCAPEKTRIAYLARLRTAEGGR